MQLCDLPTRDILAGYADRSLSPVEVIDAFLKRIDSLNPLLNAFRVVDYEGARAAANTSEARWRAGAPLSPLDGLPASLKDQWLLKGFSTRSGSLTTDANKLANEDSPAAQRLREGGAVFVGKTTLCEFSWNGVNRSPLTGEGRNPWNPRKNSGGSSGGAAIAAAARMSILNVASDGAGSIRIPAAFCGVFGFKPTYGRVPAYPQGLLPNCSHTGPITATVAEAALMMDAITRYDPREWQAVGDPAPAYLARLEEGLKGKRIAYAASFNGEHVDPRIAATVQQALQSFARMGAEIVEATPDVPTLRSTFEAIYLSSLAAGLGTVPEALREQMDPGYLRNALRGQRYTAEDLHKALLEREALGRTLNLFHEQVDLLITPQLATPAFDCGHDVPPGSGMQEWWDWSPYTYLFNLTQQPAASVPCGFTPEGLPIALQIVAARNQDTLVLQAARCFERMHPFALPDVARFHQ